MDPQPEHERQDDGSVVELRNYRFALHAAMQIAGVSCKQVAESCGWVAPYIVHLRIGHRTIGPAQIEKLANACGLSVKAFWGLAGMGRAELISMVEDSLRRRLK